MATEKVVSRKGRHWIISSGLPSADKGDPWAACLLSSTQPIPLSFAEGVARVALIKNCPLIAIQSPNSEEVHDQIDAVLEGSGGENVITTWHEGSAEGLEDAIITVEDTGLAGTGVVRVWSDEPTVVQCELEAMP